MFYDVSFTIPANTAKASPTTQDVKLTHGVIHRVEVGFPSGPRYMVHVAIRRGLHQVWPTNPQGSFNSDSHAIVINEFYPMLTEPYILTLQGWSPDTSYDHTIKLRFGILPMSVLMPEETFIEPFKKLFRRLRIT